MTDTTEAEFGPNVNLKKSLRIIPITTNDAEDLAFVKAIYIEGGDKRWVLFKFIRAGGFWKIDDIVGKDNGSLRAMLK